jgi:hypothetical protein
MTAAESPSSAGRSLSSSSGRLSTMSVTIIQDFYRATVEQYGCYVWFRSTLADTLFAKAFLKKSMMGKILGLGGVK